MSFETIKVIPMTVEKLAEDMQKNRNYYFDMMLTASTIRNYVSRGQIPALQHVVKGNALEKKSGRWYFLSSEIRQWIAFGANADAAFRVVKQRDYSQIAQAVS